MLLFSTPLFLTLGWQQVLKVALAIENDRDSFLFTVENALVLMVKE